MKQIKKIVLCTLLLFLAGCTKQADSNNNSDDGKNVIGFFDKYAIKDKEDGWYAYLYIEVNKNDQKSEKMKDNYNLKNMDAVFFDIVNLKHQAIDGFYVSVKNENGNEVEKISTVMPSYVQSPMYQEELEMINEYLTIKKFQKPITIEDLSDLETKNIDKNDIVELYNEALKTEPKEKVEDQYDATKETNLRQKELVNGDSIQFAYIDKWNAIGTCELEYIYRDGTNLSDLTANGKATQEQKELQEKLDKIEEHIEKNLPYKEQPKVGDLNLDMAIEEVITKAIKG